MQDKMSQRVKTLESQLVQAEDLSASVAAHQALRTQVEHAVHHIRKMDCVPDTLLINAMDGTDVQHSLLPKATGWSSVSMLSEPRVYIYCNAQFV